MRTQTLNYFKPFLRKRVNIRLKDDSIIPYVLVTYVGHRKATIYDKRDKALRGFRKPERYIRIIRYSVSGEEKELRVDEIVELVRR